MKTIPTSLMQHMQGDLTTMCTMWKATLTNGVIHTYTDLDCDVVYDGKRYLTSGGYSATTIDSSAELNPDNLEIDGFLSGDSITEADLHSGVWDYAAIEIFEVNYTDIGQGRSVLRSGTLGEVKSGRLKFTAELRGLMQAYSQIIVRLTTQNCTADLGDARCKAPLPVTAGTVLSSVNNRRLATTVLSVADVHTGGLLRFTSGLNAGLSMEVMQSQADGVLYLHEAMPFLVGANDTFTVTVGCTKRYVEDCIGKFNNGINFRGFPYIPGVAIYNVGGVSGTVPKPPPAPAIVVPVDPALTPPPDPTNGQGGGG